MGSEWNLNRQSFVDFFTFGNKTGPEPERKTWKGRIDFVLACLGYEIGLGNVWRFPYLCFNYGGSAFLLPYIIMQLLAGVPLLFMEMSVGQFTSQGPVTAWGMTPLLSGLGWSMVMICAMVCVYYNVIIMYALLYIVLSLVNIGWPVPWASCDNVWNTKEFCRTAALPDLNAIVSMPERISVSLGIKDHTCIETVSQRLKIGSSEDDIKSYFLNQYDAFEGNYSVCNIKYSLPSHEYWNRFILSLSDNESIGAIGDIVGRNTIFLLITWVIIFFCVLRGPQSIAKVVYFTATYPLGILVVFLIRGLTTPGFNEGIDYYIIPKWEKLLNVEVWAAATLQVLYTVGVGFGGLLTFSSYNKFNNNIFRDALIVSSVNAGTSIFAGFVTFALIGSIAHDTNRPVTELVESGPELVFVIYPQALSRLPSPAIWSVLYFLMVFTLGLDSQFGMMETIVVGVTDRFPDSVGKHRVKFVFFCCVVGFLFGIPLTTKGGIYVLNLFNWYTASYSLMILGLVQLVMISWIYGVKHFVRDLELMIGKKPKIFWVYWVIMWLVVTPIVIMLTFIFAMISYSPAEYDEKTIPAWAEFLGWLMVLLPILCVLGRALKILLYRRIPDSRFRCLVCGSQNFRQRCFVVRHIVEQHSCFSYQCNLCSRILVRTGPHQQLLEKAPCPGKPGDALLFQRQSGIKGKEAEKLYTEYKEKTLPTQWEEYLDTSVPKPVSPLKASPLRRSRLSTPKKRKRDSTISRKSPPRKVIVTPVEEETWDKDPVEIELSYPEPASPAHIQGVTFSSPEKIPPTKEKTDEPEQAREDAGRLIPEEENPQLDFVEETTVPPNDQITDETTRINPDDLFAGTANRVDFSGSSYHQLVRIQTKFNHPEATIQSPVEAQCEGFNPNVNLLINSTFGQLQKVQEGRVVLNIGGQCFHTSMVTLGAEPNSILGLLSVRDCPMRPHRNCYYFDRDPAHFKFILNYLPNGAHLEMLTLPHEKRYLLELLTEARFFRVQGLVKIILDRLEQVTKSRDF